MESWRLCWRKGFVPLMSTAALEALRTALFEDDARLIQAATTSPPPLLCVQDWPVEAADVVSFGIWQAEGLTTVAEVEEAFARLCFDCDQRLCEPAGCRWFINWADETPRDNLRIELLPEVELALSERAATAKGEPSS